jgi:hypothetical protein
MSSFLTLLVICCRSQLRTGIFAFAVPVPISNPDAEQKTEDSMEAHTTGIPGELRYTRQCE